jgi:hypothetical protein
MIGGEITPGKWQMTSCTNSTATNCHPERSEGPASPGAATISFERSMSIPVTFPPHTTITYELTLKEKGTPYSQRPDLGISSDDVTLEGHMMKVVVHSLGAIDAPASKLTLRDVSGKVLATAPIPALKAPLDLVPKTATITLHVADTKSVPTDTLTIDSRGPAPEITLVNNQITIGSLDRTQNPAEKELHARR